MDDQELLRDRPPLVIGGHFLVGGNKNHPGKYRGGFCRWSLYLHPALILLLNPSRSASPNEECAIRTRAAHFFTAFSY